MLLRHDYVRVMRKAIMPKFQANFLFLHDVVTIHGIPEALYVDRYVIFLSSFS